MKVAYVCSNVLPISNTTQKGTEIFNRILLNSLAKQHDNTLDVTVFASGDSEVPFPLISVNSVASQKNPEILPTKHIMFELALLSKAFSLQDEFDVYHVNIGNGDIALPFAPFVKKPIVITVHNTLEDAYVKPYFQLFSHLSNVFFITPSDAQKKIAPQLSHCKTIHHGIEEESFAFSALGGETLLWAGRGIPEKGLSAALDVAKSTGKKLTLCVIRTPEYEQWVDTTILNAQQLLSADQLTVYSNVERDNMGEQFQKSKVFLFPIQWEEPFGLVIAESMACGTPVVAFARGALPEIVEDGVTGFLVNPSDTDIRGNFVIQKSGIEGLVEAVQRVYQMPEDTYLTMRKACQARVEKHFSVSTMVKEYREVYKELCEGK